VNDGWGENPNKPTFGIANWPRSHKKPLVSITAPITSSTNLFAQDQQPIEIKSSSLKLRVHEKGKQPLVKSPSIESSQFVSTHSKADTKKTEGHNKREISHLVMYSELSQY
jgi:hypothetical protein